MIANRIGLHEKEAAYAIELSMRICRAQLRLYWFLRPVTYVGLDELIAPHPSTVSDCLIEFESSIGGKMRVQSKGSAPPD
jgi:hypothetical protein